jgi:hypothetical protein
MDEFAPKARFDAIAEMLKLDEPALESIRYSVNTLLPKLGELAGMWDETLRGQGAGRVIGEIAAPQRAELQSRLAIFIMRAISCVFDDAFCDYAQEFARDPSIPPRVIPVALDVAFEFVVKNLAAKIDDPRKLKDTLVAWNRLICTLREFAA